MRAKRLLALLAVTALVVGAAAPGALAAATDDGGIDVSVTQQADTGAATVAVTDGGSAVENATVNVSVGENDTYAGTGSYQTDANGTVALPEPNETVTVTVAVTAGDWNGSDTGELVPREESLAVGVTQDADGAATVTVTQYDAAVANATVNVSATGNATYAGDGSYTTDENGTASLPAPEENVTVAVTATAGDLNASTTADLVASGDDDAEREVSFGWRVSQFVHALQNESDQKGGLGAFISAFVTAHNPGKAAGHAEAGDHGQAADDHGRSGEDHGQANATDDDHGQTDGDHGQADATDDDHGRSEHATRADDESDDHEADHGRRNDGEDEGHGAPEHARN